MRIAVSGSTSSIGTHLVHGLIDAGHEVIPLGGQSSQLWKIGMKFPDFLEVDVLMHLAHDRSLTLRENVQAMEVLTSSFQGEIIFLSSMSAHSGARSVYGKSKYELERLFLKHGGKVLRAGLVYGSNIGGMYAILSKISKLSPVIPMPYSGTPKMYTTQIDDLCDELIDLISRPEKGIVFGAHSWPITLNNLLRSIRKQTSPQSSLILIPIPRIVLEIIRRSLSPFKLRLSLIDSLASLSTQISSSEISSLVPPIKDFRIFKVNL